MTTRAAGGPLKLLVLEGDGIGPEITAATVRVLEAVDRKLGLGLLFETAQVGFAALRQLGTTFPEDTFAKARQADGIILAPLSHLDYPPVAEGGLNPSGELRRRLDLYANIRPATAFDGGNAIVPGTDLVIVRENTQGFYADRSTFAGTGEFMPTPDTAIAMCIVTRPAVERIARVAFALAMRRDKRTPST